ncbi:MAG: C40 family peptidase [Proteobacteria bacterium]|nr:C40 family peptidase [Pseudomonadota bacterium]
MIKKILLISFCFLISSLNSIFASPTAKTQIIPINQLQGYEEFSFPVKKIIDQALVLTQRNLTYLYGSADPQRGGMDCSGTIYYLLQLNNLTDVPRSSSEIYKWVLRKGNFYPVTATNFSSAEFDHLKPGDLLFWEGTYKTTRNPPITHVMLYLGINKDHQPLMFGSSNGRSYQGKQMWGVSVFDFKLPDATASARFVGYSCIPHLTCDKNYS